MNNEQKVKTVQQWLEALQESARTAVEALSKDTPLGKDPPSLDERSKNLGAAIHKIRELVRPEPKTVAFLEEEAWYRMKREAKPSGEYRTSKWRARAQVCGKVLFYLEAASKCLAIECALVAMSRYLIRSHRAAWRTYRKAAKGKEVK